MKILSRVICICIVFAMAATSLTGCSSKNSSSEAADGTQSSAGRQGGGNWQGGGNRENGTESGAPSQSAGDSTQNGGVPQQGGTAGGTSSSQNQILGTVTSIIGNEVELAVGTQSSDQSSSKLTATGETKTLLIPVGLSLSSSFSGTGIAGAFPAGGNTAVSGSNAMPGGNAAGGTGTAAAGTSRTGTGTTTRSAGNTTARSTTGAATKTSGTAATTKRTSDFSTITKGMVLRITQRMINGTLTIVRVAIVSK